MVMMMGILYYVYFYTHVPFSTCIAGQLTRCLRDNGYRACSKSVKRRQLYRFHVYDIIVLILLVHYGRIIKCSRFSPTKRGEGGLNQDDIDIALLMQKMWFQISKS